MRRALMWFLAGLLVVSAGGIGVPDAVSVTGSCSDPSGDTFPRGDPATKGAGKLDVVRTSHDDGSEKVRYTLETASAYDTADVGKINWFVYSGSEDDDVGGRLWVRPGGDGLIASLIAMTDTASGTVVATPTAVHEEGTRELTVEFDDEALAKLDVEGRYDYTVETTEANERRDETEPCTHELGGAATSPTRRSPNAAREESPTASASPDDTETAEGGTPRASPDTTSEPASGGGVWDIVLWAVLIVSVGSALALIPLIRKIPRS